MLFFSWRRLAYRSAFTCGGQEKDTGHAHAHCRDHLCQSISCSHVEKTCIFSLFINIEQRSTSTTHPFRTTKQEHGSSSLQRKQAERMHAPTFSSTQAQQQQQARKNYQDLRREGRVLLERTTASVYFEVPCQQHHRKLLRNASEKMGPPLFSPPPPQAPKQGEMLAYTRLSWRRERSALLAGHES